MGGRPSLAMPIHGWTLAEGGPVGGILAVFAGSALLAASAWVQVPMWPVPTTMQTFAVLVIGAHYRPWLGAATVVAYLMEAALGLPVLAGGRPFGGATSGYLAGFLLAVVVVSWAVRSGGTRRDWPRLLGALLLGQASIYVPGLVWLDAVWLHDLPATLAAGLLPFLPGDALKLLLAAVVLRLLQRTTKAHHHPGDSHADD